MQNLPKRHRRRVRPPPYARLREQLPHGRPRRAVAVGQRRVGRRHARQLDDERGGDCRLAPRLERFGRVLLHPIFDQRLHGSHAGLERDDGDVNLDVEPPDVLQDRERARWLGVLLRRNRHP
eukprot:2932306-Prymnesium_polylepis.1